MHAVLRIFQSGQLSACLIPLFRHLRDLRIGIDELRVLRVALFFGCGAPFFRGSERFLKLYDLSLERRLRFGIGVAVRLNLFQRCLRRKQPIPQTFLGCSCPLQILLRLVELGVRFLQLGVKRFFFLFNLADF